MYMRRDCEGQGELALKAGFGGPRTGPPSWDRDKMDRLNPALADPSGLRAHERGSRLGVVLAHAHMIGDD